MCTLLLISGSTSNMVNDYVILLAGCILQIQGAYGIMDVVAGDYPWLKSLARGLGSSILYGLGMWLIIKS